MVVPELYRILCKEGINKVCNNLSLYFVTAYYIHGKFWLYAVLFAKG